MTPAPRTAPSEGRLLWRLLELAILGRGHLPPALSGPPLSFFGQHAALVIRAQRRVSTSSTRCVAAVIAPNLREHGLHSELASPVGEARQQPRLHSPVAGAGGGWRHRGHERVRRSDRAWATHERARSSLDACVQSAAEAMLPGREKSRSVLHGEGSEGAAAHFTQVMLTRDSNLTVGGLSG